MQSEEYKKYMRSSSWDRKRAERLEIDNFSCVMCGRPHISSKYPNGILQVHHIHYGNLMHENVFEDLVSLCPSCHRKIHKYYGRVRAKS